MATSLYQKSLEKEITTFATILESHFDDGGTGFWAITLKESDIAMMISLEQAEDATQVPVLSLAMVIGKLNNASREDLLTLLSINSDLRGCALSAANISDEWVLLLQRLSGEINQKNELFSIVMEMATQFAPYADTAFELIDDDDDEGE